VLHGPSWSSSMVAGGWTTCSGLLAAGDKLDDEDPARVGIALASAQLRLERRPWSPAAPDSRTSTRPFASSPPSPRPRVSTTRTCCALPRARPTPIRSGTPSPVPDRTLMRGSSGLPVDPGTVATTSAGALKQRGIKRIYHAAITSPLLDDASNDYQVTPRAVGDAIHNIFRQARADRMNLNAPLRSIGLPLFGAGRGGLDAEASFDRIRRGLNAELSSDPSWSIHFVSWNPKDVDMMRLSCMRTSGAARRAVRRSTSSDRRGSAGD